MRADEVLTQCHVKNRWVVFEAFSTVTNPGIERSALYDRFGP